jgi:phosphatidylinositol kinase/protein kinase (PI-3  family)
MKIGKGVQAIMRLNLINFRVCNVGITDGRVYELSRGSGAMIYVPSFIKIGSAIEKLIGRIHIETHRYTNSKLILSGYFYFYKIRKVG